MTDSGSTVFKVWNGGTLVEHGAYALGFGDESGLRYDLLEFAKDVRPLVVNGADTDPEVYEPTQWIVEQNDVYDAESAGLWPFDTPPVEGCFEFDEGEFPGGLPGSFTPQPGSGAGLAHVYAALPWDCPS